MHLPSAHHLGFAAVFKVGVYGDTLTRPRKPCTKCKMHAILSVRGLRSENGALVCFSPSASPGGRLVLCTSLWLMKKLDVEKSDANE